MREVSLEVLVICHQPKAQEIAWTYLAKGQRILPSYKAFAATKLEPKNCANSGDAVSLYQPWQSLSICRHCLLADAAQGLHPLIAACNVWFWYRQESWVRTPPPKKSVKDRNTPLDLYLWSGNEKRLDVGEGVPLLVGNDKSAMFRYVGAVLGEGLKVLGNLGLPWAHFEPFQSRKYEVLVRKAPSDGGRNTWHWHVPVHWQNSMACTN